MDKLWKFILVIILLKVKCKILDLGRAACALFNHMYYEAGRMAHEHAEAALIKESLLGLPRPALGMTLQDEESKASRWTRSAHPWAAMSKTTSPFELHDRNGWQSIGTDFHWFLPTMLSDSLEVQQPVLALFAYSRSVVYCRHRKSYCRSSESEN
jgi:hypothetical protein